MPNKSPKARKMQTAQLHYWVSCFGKLALSEISPALIGEERDKLSRQTHYRHTTYCKTTINRYLAILSHVFSVAVRDWYWLEENPVLKVRKAKEDNGRVRFLSDTEREALLSACRASPNQHLYPAVILALSTGMRQMEILSLTWADVDLARGRIILQETKNGDRRSVPLVGHAREIIMALGKVRRIDTRMIFPSRNNTPASLRKPWEKALAVAGVENFRFHDLRHTAASYLAMNGASLLEIAEILGHKTLQMVKRYAHLADSHTAQVVERMNQAVFK
jgi:integrase